MHLTPSIYFLVVVLQLAGQRTFSADSQYSNYFFLASTMWLVFKAVHWHGTLRANLWK